MAEDVDSVALALVEEADVAEAVGDDEEGLLAFVAADVACSCDHTTFPPPLLPSSDRNTRFCGFFFLSSFLKLVLSPTPPCGTGGVVVVVVAVLVNETSTFPLLYLLFGEVVFVTSAADLVVVNGDAGETDDEN